MKIFLEYKFIAEFLIGLIKSDEEEKSGKYLIFFIIGRGTAKLFFEGS
jgi:hypothetical protein